MPLSDQKYHRVERMKHRRRRVSDTHTLTRERKTCPLILQRTVLIHIRLKTIK